MNQKIKITFYLKHSVKSNLLYATSTPVLPLFELRTKFPPNRVARATSGKRCRIIAVMKGNFWGVLKTLFTQQFFPRCF